MRRSRYLLLIILSTAMGIGVWAALRFTAPKGFWHRESVSNAAISSDDMNSERWAQAVAKVKEERIQSADATVALEVPPELRHYEERRWFLATQVAEVKKHSIHNFADYLDLAATIQRGEMIAVPAVTDEYVLFGVGARADDRAFSRSENGESVSILDETQLTSEYQRLSEARSDAIAEIARLNRQAGTLKKGDRAGRRNLEKEISARRQQVATVDEEKTQLEKFYGRPDMRQKLFSDYQALQSLATSFRGRTYDLTNAADRQALKVSLLSSLRPEAFRVLKEIASAYHGQFARPLPVSSLVRPEEYQHVLRRYNRAAVLIDTPPHSTGLAFDIDYRYMSVAEQNFVMAQLARLKQAGRIEVLRERAANFHVFAFIDGTRPSDELVKSSLEDVGPSPPDDTTDGKAPKASNTASKRSAAKSAKRGPVKSRARPVTKKARKRR